MGWSLCLECGCENVLEILCVETVLKPEKNFLWNFDYFWLFFVTSNLDGFKNTIFDNQYNHEIVKKYNFDLYVSK